MEEEKPENASPVFENKEENREENNEEETGSSEATTADNEERNGPKTRRIIKPRKPLSKDATLKGSFISDVPIASDSDSSLMNAKVNDINNNDDDRASSSSSTSSNDDDEEEEFVKVGERTTSFITHSGEKTVELSTVCTQTENSWLKDLDLFEELLQRKPEWIGQIRSTQRHSGKCKLTANIYTQYKVHTPLPCQNQLITS